VAGKMLAAWLREQRRELADSIPWGLVTGKMPASQNRLDPRFRGDDILIGFLGKEKI